MLIRIESYTSSCIRRVILNTTFYYNNGTEIILHFVKFATQSKEAVERNFIAENVSRQYWQ